MSTAQTQTVNPGGRPPIGPAFSIRFDDELRGLVDGAADEVGQSRAEWLRQAAQEKLGRAGRPELAAFVEWMINEQVEASEIGRAIKKPWAYTDWSEVFRRGGSLDELDDLAGRIGSR